MRSNIENCGKYEFYLITTSKNIEWQHNVTNTFRNYFNNSKLNFTAANMSTLIIPKENMEISKSFKTTFSIMTVFFGICIRY